MNELETSTMIMKEMVATMRSYHVAELLIRGVVIRCGAFVLGIDSPEYQTYCDNVLGK